MKRVALHAIALATLIILIGWAWIPSARADMKPVPDAEEMQKWMVEKMVQWAKPGITFHPPAMESFEDGKARYGLIANAVLHTVSKEKSMFGGQHGRIRTATLLLSISMFESAYRKDVDMNLGKEGRGDGGRSWCLMQVQLGSPIYVDSQGKRVSLAQVCKMAPTYPGSSDQVQKCEYVPPPGAIASTPSRIVFVKDGYEITSDQTRGYSGQDLVANRELCFTAGLRIVWTSFNACKSLPMAERLSAYASGNCKDGKEASRRRMGAAVRWMTSSPPPMNDARMVQFFTPTVTPPAPTEIPVAFGMPLP